MNRRRSLLPADIDLEAAAVLWLSIPLEGSQVEVAAVLKAVNACTGLVGPSSLDDAGQAITLASRLVALGDTGGMRRDLARSALWTAAASGHPAAQIALAHELAAEWLTEAPRRERAELAELAITWLAKAASADVDLPTLSESAVELLGSLARERRRGRIAAQQSGGVGRRVAGVMTCESGRTSEGVTGLDDCSLADVFRDDGPCRSRTEILHLWSEPPISRVALTGVAACLLELTLQHGVWLPEPWLDAALKAEDGTCHMAVARACAEAAHPAVVHHLVRSWLHLGACLGDPNCRAALLIELGRAWSEEREAGGPPIRIRFLEQLATLWMCGAVLDEADAVGKARALWLARSLGVRIRAPRRARAQTIRRITRSLVGKDTSNVDAGGDERPVVPTTGHLNVPERRVSPLFPDDDWAAEPVWYGNPIDPEALGADLKATFPWASDFADHVAGQIALVRHGGGPVVLGPTALICPPDALASDVIQWLCGRIKVPTFIWSPPVGGASRRNRSTGRSSHLLNFVKGCANPAIIIDLQEMGTLGSKFDGGLDQVLALVADQCSWHPQRPNLDGTATNWFAVMPDTDSLPPVLKSCFQAVQIERPGPAHFSALMAHVRNREASRLGISAERLPKISDAHRRRIRRAWLQSGRCTPMLLREYRNALTAVAAHSARQEV